MSRKTTTICRVLLMVCLLTGLWGSSSHASAAQLQDLVPPRLWVPNDTVLAAAVSGSTLYIGGTFTQVGPPTGRFAAVDASTGLADTELPPVGGGSVRAIAADGSGGWFIGGDFQTVDGQPRSGLAHIRADKTLNPTWNPSADRTVYALALTGTTLYVGGVFTTIAGQSRPYLAALDRASGNLTSWDPQCMNSVYALALSGTTLYAGGAFGMIGGTTRNRAAALDTTVTTNIVKAWNPNVSGTGAVVYALALDATSVYLGGTFTTVGGVARSYLAAVDATTGSLSDWAPAPSAQVDALLLSGTTLYTGGRFTTIGGQSRRHLAALDTTLNSNNATAWNPNPSSGGWVSGLALQGSTLYAVGRFTSIGGQTRRYLAALDTTTANAGAWNPDPNSNLYSVAVSGNSVAVGGSMTSLNGITRNGIAAIDLTTGALTNWNPNALSGSTPGTIHSIAVTGTTVYAGGYFGTIGGQTRSNLAALDTTVDTNNATAWAPNPNAAVKELALSGTTLYAGGSFTTIGGQNRGRIAALDTTANTNNATDWDPNVANGTVNALLLSGSTLYIGGSFTSVGAQARNYVAALDTTVTSGIVAAWNPHPDDDVYALAMIGNTVYLGGDFWEVGGETREYVAGVDATTGLPTAWNPILQYSPTNSVYALAVSGDILFVGGGYYYVNDVPQSYLAAFEPQTYGSQPLNWSPWLTDTVYFLLAQDDRIYVGGDFDNADWEAQAYLACLSIDIPRMDQKVFLPMIKR